MVVPVDENVDAVSGFDIPVVRLATVLEVLAVFVTDEAAAGLFAKFSV